jgi:hypothetical protein
MGVALVAVLLTLSEPFHMCFLIWGRGWADQGHDPMASNAPVHCGGGSLPRARSSRDVRVLARVSHDGPHAGGRACWREDPAAQQRVLGSPNAIPGVHSAWVVGGPLPVLAMARPWQSSVAAHGLVAAFRTAGIGMILNLQEVGGLCGRWLCQRRRTGTLLLLSEGRGTAT